MADVIAELVAKLGYVVDDKPLDQFEKSTDAAGKSAEGLTAKIAKGTAAFATFAAGVAASAVKLGAAIVGEFSESGAEIDKWSKKLGASARELQRFEFAGKKVGAGADNVREAVKTLRENLGEMARVGSGPAVDSLGTLGIKLDEISGLGVEEQMGLIATALAELPDQAQRVSVALELMGEDGGALLPLFAQGAEGIKRLGDEAERTGQVMTDEQVAAAKEAAEGYQKLDAITKRVTNTVGAALAPALTDIAQKAEAWVEQNDDFISQDLPAALTAIAEATGSVVAFFADAAAMADDFATEVRQLGERIEEDYGPAIDSVVETGDAVLEVFTAIPSAVGDAIEEVLRFVGVLDQVQDQLYAITGIRHFETTDERGAPDFLGDPGGNARRKAFSDEAAAQNSTELGNRIATETDAKRRAALQRAQAAALQREAEIVAGAFRTQRAAEAGLAQAEVREKQAAERAKRRKKFEAQAKGGGGSGKVDTRQAEALFGDRLRDLGTFAGASDKAMKKALEAAASSLKEGASESVAFGAGVGAIESATGATLQTDSVQTALEGALRGFGSGIGGGGASPTAGAQFVRIDASFTAPTTIEIVLPPGAVAGLSPGETLQLVEAQIGEALDARNLRAFDHYKRAVEV